MQPIQDDIDTDLLLDLLDDTAAPVTHDIADTSEDIFALTSIQRGYLLGRDPNLPLGGAACQFYYQIECDALDIPRYKAAWRKLFQRHEMLRVEILPDATQRIRAMPEHLDMPVHDLRGMAATDESHFLEVLEKRLARDLPDAEKWPLFDLEFTQHAQDQVNIHLRFDLLNTDQQSILILLNEAALIYAGQEHALADLRLDFKTYQSIDKGCDQAALNYWTTRAATLPNGPDLPLRCAIEDIQQVSYARLQDQISADDWQKFQQIARNADVTPSCMLLECFGRTLSRWSAHPHFCINMTLFDRAAVHPDVDLIVGDFTNNMLVEMNFTNPRHSRSLDLQVLQADFWQGLEHSRVSGVDVMGLMAKARGHLDRPLMPIVFTSTISEKDAEILEKAKEHLVGTPVVALSQTAQVLLDNQVSVRDGVLEINWDVADNVIAADVAELLLADYLAQIEALIADPNLLDRPAVSRDPKEADVLPPPDTKGCIGLADIWKRIATSANKSPAIITGSEQLTHAQLAQHVAGIAAGLIEQGIKPGDHIPVLIEKSPLQIACVLAVSLVGAVFVPIDVTQPDARRDKILSDLQPVLILHATDDTKLGFPVWDVRDVKLLGPNTLPKFHTPCPTDTAYIIYTSGSTGQPKGVVVSHQAALNTIFDVNQRFAITAEDKVLALSEMHFDLAIYDVFGVLGCGGAVVLPTQTEMRDPAQWTSLCDRNDVTVWNTVPGLFYLYLDYIEARDHKPRHVLNTIMLSGDWIALDLPDRAHEFWPKSQFFALGGATEAAIWSIFHHVDQVDPSWTSIPYGTALGGQQVFVLSKNLHICPPGRVADIYIAGRGLASAYYNDAVKTDDAFILHPRTGLRLYKTGDLGAYDKNGVIVFHGRSDTQLKVNGYRVELGEVARAVRDLPQVDDCVAFAHKGSIAAAVRGSRQPDTAQLQDALAKQLPQHMLPKHWIHMAQWPLTGNGKIDQRALAALVTDQPQSRDQMQVNRDDATQICAIVASVLGCEKVSLSDNLISLGATSLELIALATRIEGLVGTRPPLTALARAVNLPDLIQLVTDLKGPHEPESGQEMHLWPQEAALRQFLKTNNSIADPVKRKLFTNAVRASSENEPTHPQIELPVTGASPQYPRKTMRDFVKDPIGLGRLSKLLLPLRTFYVDGHLKRGYASPSGLYPVQPYFVFQGEGVSGVALGQYAYHAAKHSLSKVGTASPPDFSELSAGNTNWIGAGQFLIVFVLNLDHVVPLYEGDSLPFGLIETGAMSQLLETVSVPLGIGLSQIGDISMTRLHDILSLSDTQICLHAMVGGAISPTAVAQFHEAIPSFQLDIAEGTL